VTAGQTVEHLNIGLTPLPAAHELPATTIPDHAIVSGVRHELGQPINIDSRWQLRRYIGQPVLAQAIDRDGNPALHTPPVEMLPPEVQAEMTADEVVADVVRRMELAKALPQQPTPPIIGRLALLSGKSRKRVVRTLDDSDLTVYSNLYRVQPILPLQSPWTALRNQFHKSRGLS